MTSSQQARTNYARRFIFFAAAIVLAIVGYTAAWHYAADRIVRNANAAIADLNRGSERRAACENLDARGYPFRIGLFCHSVMYVEQSEGISLRAGSLRSAAQVYNPFQAMAELDGPATVELPGMPAVDVGWQDMRASLRLARPLPERVSVEASTIVIDPDSGRIGDAPLVAMDNGQFHMRPAEEDLDIAIRFTAMTLSQVLTDGADLPPLDGLADVRLLGGALSGHNLRDGLRGKSFDLRQISLSTPDEAGAVISGPLSVDREGLIDAELQVRLREPARIAERLAALFPERRDEIRMGFQALAAMGEEPTLPLRIDRGRMRLGFIRLGDLPAM